MKNLLQIPHTCILCHETSDRGIDLCLSCEKDLPFIHHPCPICGRSLSSNQIICGQCLTQKNIFHRTIALFHYQDIIRKLIIDLKFHQQFINGKILGQLMAQHLLKLSMGKPDVIIPVPLHPKRLKQRGFNQSYEIAKVVAKKLALPIDIQHCNRIKYTQAQTSLPENARHQNIKNAFVASNFFRGQSIAIVDDVITTGETLNELCRTLKHNGAHQIELWCIARTRLKNL